MTPVSFDVRTTTAFERAPTRSRSFQASNPMAKYRIRLMRFRFIYDVDGQAVYLRYCGLRTAS